MTTATPDRWSMLLDRWQAVADSGASLQLGPGALAAAATSGREMQAPHLDLIDDAYARIADGRMTKRGVIITMPPRHGKSQRASRWGPLWYLQRNPDKQVVIVCHTQDLADDHARWVKETIEAPPWVEGRVYNFGLRINATSKAVRRFGLEGHRGGVRALGVAGPLTGRGADLLIIDDPIKAAADADSKVIRDGLWDWWESTASNRLEPGGKVIVILTRWHEDDIAGRLLAREPDDWEQINLPALAEADDLLNRAPGAALWPGRFDRDALQFIRGHLSPRWWAAQYQQRPAPTEGSIWQGDWITDNRVLIGNVPLGLRTIVAIDPAVSSGEKAAEHGILAMGFDRDGAYVLDDVSLRGDPSEACLAAWRLAADMDAVAVVIEENQGQEWLSTVLRTTWPEVAREKLKEGLRLIMPAIEPVRAKVGKRLRAEPVAAFYRQGLVHHVDDGSGRLSEVEQQMIGWTGDGDSPDRLDALVHGLTWGFEPGRGKGDAKVISARFGRVTGRR